MKQRILIVGNSLDCGGVQKALLNLVNTLVDESYEVSLLLANSDGDWLPFLDSRVVLLKTPSFFCWLSISKNNIFKSINTLKYKPKILLYYMYFIFKGLFFRNMTQARQEFGNMIVNTLPHLETSYNIVLDFTGSYKRYILDRINSNYKITWVHSDYRVLKKNSDIDRKLFHRFDKIACVSDSCKDIFDSIFPDLSSKSFVIHNMIGAKNVLKLAKEGISYNDDFSGIRIISVMRLDPNKRLDLAIQTLYLLRSEGYNIRWYVLGDGPYKEVYNKMVRDSNLEDNFIFLGQIDNPYPYILNSDIFIHCSDFEGRSVAVDEALALNRYVILTDYPTAKDQVTHGVNGSIVALDPVAIAKEIKLVVKDCLFKCHKNEFLNLSETISKQGFELFDHI